MAFFGIVILPKPTDPIGPVTVNAIVVVVVSWFDMMVAFDICWLVMFPLIAISTVAPLLSIVAVTVVGNGVGVSDGVGVGVFVGLVVGLGAGS